MGEAQQRVAFVFPGQGSQAVGMGRDWYEQTDVGRQLFDRADDALGYRLSHVCFEGPEELLRKTYNAQAGLFVCSAIVFEALRSHGVSPVVVAGHSLGEYSALYAAGVLDFPTALSLVRVRGEAMGQAAEDHPGAMAAVLGLDPCAIEAICRDISGDSGMVQVANFNSPAQTVISGERQAVERASEAAKAAGTRRVIVLPVHGAFHSPLMKPAVPPMQAALAKATFHDPQVPFLANTDGDFLSDAQSIRASLARQITHCVRWSEIMSKIAAMGVEAVVEVGPGRVLCGLWRQSGSTIAARPCSTVEEARALISELETPKPATKSI